MYHETYKLPFYERFGLFVWDLSLNGMDFMLVYNKEVIYAHMLGVSKCEKNANDYFFSNYNHALKAVDLVVVGVALDTFTKSSVQQEFHLLTYWLTCDTMVQQGDATIRHPISAFL